MDAALQGGDRLLVLAPGLLCDPELWKGVCAHLARPTLVVDFSMDVSIDEMALRLLDCSPRGSDVVGFSMGAMAAIAAAANAPDRFAGLIVVSTHVERDDADRLRERTEQLQRSTDPASFEQMVAEDLPTLYFDHLREKSEEAAFVAAMARRVGPVVFRRHLKALIERPDIAALAAAVRTPTIVLAGAQDRIAPPRLTRKLAAQISGARFTELSCCGHLLPLERPDAIAHAVDALAPGATK